MAVEELHSADCKVRGDDAASKHDFKKAIECYSEAINLDPTNHVYFSCRSAAYLSKHDSTKALEDSDKCIQLNPSWAEGYGQKGAALYAIGDFENSINMYKHGLGIDPNNSHLKKGMADVENTSQKYSTPSPESLYNAASAGDLAGINALLRMGVGVNEPFTERYDQDETALGGAISCGREEAVKLLLRAGADVHLPHYLDGGGCMLPIVVALYSNGAGIMKLLIDAGASPDELTLPSEQDQLPLLHVAAARGYVQMVRVLLAGGARVDAPSKVLRLFAISFAVEYGQAGIAQLLINAGASVNVYNPENNSTPLHVAVGNGDGLMVRVLVAAGARLEARMTTTGHTALNNAAYHGKYEMVKLLVEAGADVTSTCEIARYTPLQSCLMGPTAHTHLEEARKIAQLLIKAGADVNARSGQSSVLHTAALLRCPGIVQDLLEAGADIDARDSNGNDALFLAQRLPLDQNDRLLTKGWAKRMQVTLDVLKEWKKKQVEQGWWGQAQARARRQAAASVDDGGAAAGDPGSDLTLTGLGLEEAHHLKKEGGKKKKKAKATAKKALKDQNRVCDGPDCNRVGVKMCRACKRPAYCGVECQRAHWHTGHKQECHNSREE